MLEFDSKINLATFVPLVVFVAGYFVKAILDRAEKHKKQRKYMIALATEIKLNVTALKEAVAGLPPTAAVNAFLAAAPVNRPHILSSYVSEIYTSNAQTLTDIPDILIKNIISFYGNLEWIKVIVAGFDKQSFELISQSGREAAFALLVSHSRDTAQTGEALLDSLKRELAIPDIAI